MSPPNHDEAIQQLVADFKNGYLTRRGFLAQAAAFGLTAAAAVGLLGTPTTQKSALAQDAPEATPKKWEKGKGWGWVWGEDDELGNLNELIPELALKALSKVKDGNVYDLGLAYDRRSFKFVGHSSGEIMSFRTPEGLLLHPGDKELAFVEEENSLKTTWASNALFISDNVATQIDALGHIYEGDPPSHLQWLSLGGYPERLRAPEARRRHLRHRGAPARRATQGRYPVSTRSTSTCWRGRACTSSSTIIRRL